MRPKIVWLANGMTVFQWSYYRGEMEMKKKKIKKSNPFDLMLPGYYKSDIPC